MKTNRPTAPVLDAGAALRRVLARDRARTSGLTIYSGPSISGPRQVSTTLPSSGITGTAAACAEQGDYAALRGLSAAVHQADDRQQVGKPRGWRAQRTVEDLPK